MNRQARLAPLWTAPAGAGLSSISALRQRLKIQEIELAVTLGAHGAQPALLAQFESFSQVFPGDLAVQKCPNFKLDLRTLNVVDLF